MRKIITLILSIGLCLLVIFTITTNSNRPGTEVVYQTEYDDYLVSNEMDPSMYTTTQKQYIYDCELKFHSDLYESNYVSPSGNPYEFQRHWGIDRLVNHEQESDLLVQAHYFESDICNKVVLLSFSVPYHVSKDQSQEFIHISHSLNYLLRVTGTMSYNKDGKEYYLKSMTASEFINGDDALPYQINMSGISLTSNDIYTENQIGIPYNNESLGYFNYPEITYNYVLQLSNSEDNQTIETDDYIGLDIDFYTIAEHIDYQVKLGFNQFSQSQSDSEMFSVKRISLSYKREES